MRMKFAAVFTLIIVLAVSTACFSAEKISMVYWPGPESEAMKEVVDYYNTNVSPESGVEVEMILFGRTGFFEKMSTMMAARSSDIDLYFTTSYIIGRHAPYLASLDQLFSETGVDDSGLEDLFASCVNALSVNNEQKGIPLDGSITALLYRKDLINQLLHNREWQQKYTEIAERELNKKLVPKHPENWNWDDFMATALFFSKEQNPVSPTRYGTALQAKNMWPTGKVWTGILKTLGGSWFNENGEPNFNNENTVKALKLYSDLVKKGASPESCINYEYTEPNETFKAGNAALLLQWGVAYSELTNKEEAPKVWDKVGVAPYPGDKVWLTVMGVGVSEASKKKEAAIKWISFLTTEKALMIYGENGGVPPQAYVLDHLGNNNEFFKYLNNYLNEYAFFEEAGDKTQDVLRVLAEHISATTAGIETPEEGAKSIQKEVEKILNN